MSRFILTPSHPKGNDIRIPNCPIYHGDKVNESPRIHYRWKPKASWDIHPDLRNVEMFSLTYDLSYYHMGPRTSISSPKEKEIQKEGTPCSCDDCGTTSSSKGDEVESSSQARSSLNRTGEVNEMFIKAFKHELGCNVSEMEVQGKANRPNKRSSTQNCAAEERAR
ncbi:hypothetical protein Tco_1115154 [Tanacetum coccineum]